MSQYLSTLRYISWLPIFQESCELDRVIDNLLQRGQSDDPETEVVGEIIMETGMYISCAQA